MSIYIAHRLKKHL